MDLGATDKVRPLISAVRAMVRDHVMPIEEEYEAEIGREGDRFKWTARMTEIMALRPATGPVPKSAVASSATISASAGQLRSSMARASSVSCRAMARSASSVASASVTAQPVWR